jgi:hypothetical protein
MTGFKARRRPRAKPTVTAREAILAWASSPGFAAMHTGTATNAEIADHLLAWLFDEGFKVVPFEADIAP